MLDLIVKNGSCYIDGKLTKADLGLSGKKIKKIGTNLKNMNICIWENREKIR